MAKFWCLDSWSLMGGGHLWEVVAYGRWTLMGGGRLWEVVTYGRWTLTRVSYHKALSRKFLAFR